MNILEQTLAALQADYTDLMLEKQDLAARMGSIDRQLTRTKAHWERLTAHVAEESQETEE